MIKLENAQLRVTWDEESASLLVIENRQTKTFCHNQSQDDWKVVFSGGELCPASRLTKRLSVQTEAEVAFVYEGEGLSIEVRYTLAEGLLRKQVSVLRSERKIHYIDAFYLRFDQAQCGRFGMNCNLWKTSPIYPSVHQADVKEMAGFPGVYVEFGQPCFFMSLFMGMEFPLGKNWLTEEEVYSRYYLGRSVDERFDLHPIVVGAAKGQSKTDLREAFFAYLREASLPVRLRKQYNSWYDHMLDIDEEKLTSSFKVVHEGFSKHGLKLDAYVLDDGWPNYESFWDFNLKFPNGLTEVQRLVEEDLGSELGLWIGPRGGYAGTQRTMSNWLASHPELKLGGWNSRSDDVDVGDFNYLVNLKRRMLELQTQYRLNYWKIDGLLLQPDVQYEDESGPYAFEHMTKVYEFLVQMLQELRAEAEPRTENYWINLTSYVNPSPWWLFWVNSLWIQNSEDVGYDAQGTTHLQRMMTYRDAKYYEFLFKREITLPLSNLYNHEPIYAATANRGYFEEQMSASPEELEQYLRFNAMRGTGFWEFYYSYSMFSEEHWAANGRAIRWVEENFDLLKLSRFVGEDPATGACYGYVCECPIQKRRLTALRNPSGESQEFRGQVLAPYEIRFIEEVL